MITKQEQFLQFAGEEDNYGNNSLLLAACSGALSYRILTQKHLKSTNNLRQTPIHRIVQFEKGLIVFYEVYEYLMNYDFNAQDIYGRTALHLLLAEFRAGHESSTRNRIVAILDQLLRRNYLNQEQYHVSH